MLVSLPSKTKPATQILHFYQNCGHMVVSNIEGDGCAPVRLQMQTMRKCVANGNSNAVM